MLICHQSDEAIEMVDAATGAHDLKGEAQLVGAMIEDSPYPEVSISHQPDYHS